jgi:predicted nucleic acid-binding protein
LDASANGRTFLDSNILVYAFDRRDTRKQGQAVSLLQQSSAATVAISAQVLGEFYWTVTRKLPVPLTFEAARAAVLSLARLRVVAIDQDLVHDAIDLSRSASIAYWDALIVKAAASAGCRRLLTEDLNHGQVIDGVRVENPFLGV